MWPVPPTEPPSHPRQSSPPASTADPDRTRRRRSRNGWWLSACRSSISPMSGHHHLSQKLDIQEDALAEATRLSGAKTKKETVNVALREFAARHRRIAALEHYATLAAGWDFEGWEHRRAAEKDPAP